ncbi:mmpL family membrane domain protein [Mycobacterium xenopi 3993]|nr:mmpL family membrane domain protein [Mycobacterium xenopi 3993]
MFQGSPKGLVMLCTIATPGRRMRLLATRSKEMKSAEFRMS